LTFSYAVLFSSLSLFMTRVIAESQVVANAYVGLFIALNFALHLIAGYMGGRYVSNRVLLLISCIFQIAGIYLLSFSAAWSLEYGLSLFLLGCGFNTTCLKCILTQQVLLDENKREMIFFINYSVMNIGFFLGFFAGGYFDLRLNYDQLFHVCNIFNLLALVFLAIGWRSYKDRTMSLKKYSWLSQFLIVITVFSILMYCMVLGFHHPSISNYLVIVFGLLALGYFIYQIQFLALDKEKKQLKAFLILTIASIVFWTLFYVGPMGVTHFLKNNVDNIILGQIVPPQWYMNLNSIFVVFGSPLLAILFKKIRIEGVELNISQQFSGALIFIALSFLVLSFGIKRADVFGYVSSFWIVTHFLFQALGEILIAPVGYAMIGKLAPKDMQGVMMGFWMLASGIAAAFSHYFSNTMNYVASTNPLLSNADYARSFNALALYAFLFSLALVLLSKKIEKLISPSDINTSQEVLN